MKVTLRIDDERGSLNLSIPEDVTRGFLSRLNISKHLDPKLIESIEQTQRKSKDEILKDGMEHHFDGWSYRIAAKYPVTEGGVRTLTRG